MNATAPRCLHNKNTSAEVRLDYLEDSGRYMVSLSVKCADCGQPFRFMGLPMGLSLNGATINPDGLEARLAVGPADRTLHPLEGVVGFGVKPS